MNDSIVLGFELQTEACMSLGSPLYAAILKVATEDIVRGGVTASVVQGFERDGRQSAVALRLMGGLHRLVLTGMAPELAAHFPTAGGEPDLEVVGDAYLATCRDHLDDLRMALRVPPQTNEIGRSMLLLPGLASAIGDGSMPVHIREIGTSAGLNLALDQFEYQTDVWRRKGAASAPVIESHWVGPAPSIPPRIDVISRAGCDTTPIDIADPQQRLRLLSFVWADQLDRFDRTRKAIELLPQIEHRIDRADAANWLAAELDDRPAGLVVVQHSVMWQYLPQDTQSAIENTLSRHGSLATRERPLAHVRFEPGPMAPVDKTEFALTVTTWPSGQSLRLASGHPHGTRVDWH